MTAQVAYKKGKLIHNRSIWVISRYTSPADVMAKDKKTMDRLDRTFYGGNYKGVRQIIIRDLQNPKPVGKVNRNAA